jgi:ABC-type transport system substrate-binding protein
MNIKKTIVAAVSIAFIFLMANSVLSAVVHNSGFPKSDEMLFKAYPGADPETVVDEFLSEVTDWLEGPGRSDLYDRVVDAGHTISELDPKAEFTFAPINNRDYQLSSGESLFPLNDSDFRLAMSYIYGMDDKQADVFGYYGVPWYYALGNPVPDAQLPYYMGTLLPNTDFDAAWAILEGAGYSVDGDDWLSKGGVKCRDPAGWSGGFITFLYSTGALVYPNGPGGGWVTNFNEFITYINATGPTMQILPTDFTTLVMELLLVRDYDIIGIGLTNLGRYVDWIYDLFHSSTDVPWGWNFVGIHDSEYDAWGETILTSMNITEVIEASQDWQEKFCYELFNWMPLIAGQEFITTANGTSPLNSDTRGELMNAIPMDNFGPTNDYTFMAMHWRGTPGTDWGYGGSIKTGLGDAPDTLNPYTDNTLYGWWLMSRAVEGLLGTNPVTVENMPWVAMEHTIESWTSIPELGITNGSTATFWIRQDVDWQDGVPATAYDCVNNMRLMRQYQFGRYSSTWANLVYEEADGPYKFNVYFYTTSLYYADYVSGTALLAPKHITDLVEELVDLGTLTEFEDWAPCETTATYASLTGDTPPASYPFMKQLVGTGPYVYDNYDRSLATGRVARYEEYFINAPVLGGIIGEWRIDPDASYTYKALLHNMGAKENAETGELTNATVYAKIYEDGVLATTTSNYNLDPWEHVYTSDYVIGTVACGLHNVTIEVFLAEDDSLVHTYVHEFVATIREDVNTYTGELLDFKVDMRDIGRAARAFGSYPGHLRWDPPTDTNEDFKTDMRDIGAIARMFGWSC